MATPTLAVPHSAASCAPKPRNRNTDPPLIFPIDQELDPLKVALSGFSDVNTYRAYYEGAGNDID